MEEIFQKTVGKKRIFSLSRCQHTLVPPLSPLWSSDQAASDTHSHSFSAWFFFFSKLAVFADDDLDFLSGNSDLRRRFGVNLAAYGKRYFFRTQDLNFFGVHDGRPRQVLELPRQQFFAMPKKLGRAHWVKKEYIQ